MTEIIERSSTSEHEHEHKHEHEHEHEPEPEHEPKHEHEHEQKHEHEHEHEEVGQHEHEHDEHEEVGQQQEPAHESKHETRTRKPSGELTADVTEKPVMVMGIDDSEHSYYALEWTLDHFFASNPSNFKLVIVHARPSPPKASGKAANEGDGDVFLPTEEVDLQKVAAKVLEKAKEICISKSVNDVLLDVVGGEAKSVMCEAVEKHKATILVVGSHGYGAIKRAVHSSVSDHFVHHAHCTVMVVKKCKTKN